MMMLLLCNSFKILLLLSFSNSILAVVVAIHDA
uniref:Uncharacterized protein n=1 Tax=Populus trichocarpa TaxID=3694 RepID=A0A3N7F2Y3_POPTR